MHPSKFNFRYRDKAENLLKLNKNKKELIEEIEAIEILLTKNPEHKDAEPISDRDRSVPVYLYKTKNFKIEYKVLLDSNEILTVHFEQLFNDY